jgi:hypothetical protein
MNTILKTIRCGKLGDQPQRCFRVAAAGFIRKAILNWVTHLQILLPKLNN